MNINYSVIIPHHNTPNLLQRLIDSIPQRDDLEIIVVDDNSDDDKKPNIVRNDVQLYYIDKDQTKGAGRARNVGLDHAKGKWLIFADSDDFFSGAISVLLDKYKDSENDIIYFKVEGRDSDTLQPVERGDVYNGRVEKYLKKKNKYSEEILRYCHYVPWGKIISKSLVDKYNIKFEEIRYSNDLMFSILIGHYAKRIEASSDVIYYITIRMGSLTNQVTLESCKCRFAVTVRRMRFLWDNKKWHLIKSMHPQLIKYRKLYGYKEVKNFISIMKENGIGWRHILMGEIIYQFFRIRNICCKCYDVFIQNI